MVFVKGMIPWNKGLKMWEDREHPRGTLGKKHSEEWKIKMSERMKGNEFRKGITPWNKGKKGLQKSWNEGKNISGMSGKKHTEETKRKITLNNKGKKRSFETIEKIKVARAKQVLPFKDSFIELKIQDFLTVLKIEFVTHKYMNIKNSYQCDIFIPSMNLIIEADGDFFHMNPNKFSPEDRTFKNGMTAKEKWKLDLDRTKQLLEKGYKVIRIWENEIKKMTIEDFKEKIIEVRKNGI